MRDVINEIKIMMALKYKKTDSVPNKIIEGLYLGSIGSACSRDILKEIGITHILCVAKGLKACWKEDFTYKLLPLLDTEEEDIFQHFLECINFINLGINEKKGKVLVHCFAGKSRSPTVVIA